VGVGDIPSSRAPFLCVAVNLNRGYQPVHVQWALAGDTKGTHAPAQAHGEALASGGISRRIYRQRTA
jgi:hypothetical protein